MINIIQIIPRLPPATDGVGDYALNLANQLRQDRSIQTHFIVCDRNWRGENTIDGFSISKVSETTAKALKLLLSQQQTDTVLLHYVGYGYAKRGCPIWLVNGLKSWRNNNSERKLLTMFHEVYAAGRPPWTSAFWLFWLQKKLAANLVRASDRILTSKQLYADILGNLSQGKHLQIPVMPVFSNVGEPKKVSDLSQRQPWLVIFGGRNNRIRAYSESYSKISHICQIFNLEKIIDIGLPTDLGLSSINGVSIIKKGILSNREIQEIFSKSAVGFLNYNPDYLAKSGIFAAYAAHGILIVNTKGSDSEIDRLESGRHYLVANYINNQTQIENLQQIANRSFYWYYNHRLKAQAKVFSEQILSCNKLCSIF